jgi:hypothetical protein
MAYEPEEIEALKGQIVEKIAIDMMSLRSVCSEKDMPSMSTVLDWLKEDKSFSLQYARACEIRAEGIADEILDIADDSSRDTKTIKNKNGDDYEVEDTEWVNRSKLRVESRKWLLAKMMPKKYGDKLDITSDNEKLGKNIQIEIVPPIL